MQQPRCLFSGRVGGARRLKATLITRGEGEGLQNNCPDLFKLPSWEVSFLKDSCVIDRKCSYMAISGAQKAWSPAVKTSQSEES